MAQSELDTLRQYVATLERQGQSKSAQLTILHRQLQALQTQLSQMEQYYFKNKQLLKQLHFFKQELDIKNQQCDKLTMALSELQKNDNHFIAQEELLKERQDKIKDLQTVLSQAIQRQQQLFNAEKIEQASKLQQKDNIKATEEQNQHLKNLLEAKELQLTELKFRIVKMQQLIQAGESQKARQLQQKIYDESVLEQNQLLKDVLKLKELQLTELKSKLLKLQQLLKAGEIKQASKLQQKLNSKDKEIQNQNQNQNLKHLLQQKELQLTELKFKLTKMQQTSCDINQSDNNNLQALIKSNISLQQLSGEQEQKIKELQQYIDELQYCCQTMNNNIQAKQIELRQYKVQILYLQKQSRYKMSQQQPEECISRSQVSSCKWSEKEFRSHPNSDRHNFQEIQNKSSLIMGQDNYEQAQSQSILSQNKPASKLLLRNSILKMQNKALLKNKAD